MTRYDTKSRPSAEYRFWAFSPDGDGVLFFRDEAERDRYAQEAIAQYCDDDGWSDDVEMVCAGEVTAIAQKTQLQKKPPEAELDEDCLDANGTYWGEFDEICDYALAPLQRASLAVAVADQPSAAGVREVRYLTDDRDLAPEDLHELVIAMGGNGDWYVSVLPKGHRFGPTVRLCTSGGASSAAPGLCPAIANAFRALAASQERGR